MKILSLRLRNFRGVEDRTVDLDHDRLILIQGANEVGKSTLCDALAVIFKFQHTSNHAAVRALRPVGREADPEVEIRIRSGRSSFTYKKRFHPRQGETILLVHEPDPEQHTGTEAHERAQAILAETCDLDLMRALQVLQGDGSAQAPLRESTALSSALSRAAGLAQTDGSEMTLLDAAQAEYAKHYDPNGKEKGELRKARDELAAATLRRQQAGAALAAVEAEVVKADALQRQLVKQRELARAATAERVCREKDAELLLTKRRQVETLTMSLDLARHALHCAERDKDERDALLAAVNAQAERQLGAEAAVAALGVAHASAVSTDRERAQALAEGELMLRRAAAALALAEADLRHLERAAECERLRNARDRVADVRREADSCRARLRAFKVEPRALAALRQEDAAVRHAEARVAAGSATVTIRAHRDGLPLAVNGAPLAIAAGGAKALPATDRLALVFGDDFTIEVEPARSAAALDAELLAAKARFAELLARLGVDGLAAAEAQVHERASLEAQAGLHEKAERAFLGKATFAALEATLAREEAALAEHLRARGQAAPLPATRDEALDTVAAAGEAAAGARSAAERARAQERSANDALTALAAQLASERAALERNAALAKGQEQRLASGREKTPDAALADAVESRRRQFEGAALLHAEAAGAYAAGNPAAAEDLLRNAAAKAERLGAEAAGLQSDLVSLNARLETLGSQGLFDAVSRAESDFAAAERVLSGLVRRAEGARLLYVTLESCRKSVHSSYAAPLKKRVEELGALVYGEGFAVSLSDDLAVIGRTRGGSTIPFDALSTGAKEQLNLIVRIAASNIAASEDMGGIPLLLDDVLGHTDPERLERMGALLSHAGRRSQVIVLTCAPERAAAIGDAVTIRM